MERVQEEGKTGICNEGYRIMISSLLKFDDVKGAEEIYGEWKPKGSDFDTRIPCLLISHYSKEGDEVKVLERYRMFSKMCNIVDMRT
ncbi:unnamed protein product [Arabidopsis lyrata]|uniref:Predicted protein n=1 Tax=Arabidopsis lyrata subsp. lyrata TaxID=81972 RepID=D7LAM2_ARALL|nr:predicted protein [Arabidopsis lyrata subsp. lyrata]CAH8260099.1 unnamed protein product [Arabidopsis lyrata]